MILLALDTATPASVAGVLRADGAIVEARDDPPPGSRGDHAARLLPLAERALAEAGVAWERLERIAVGVGPGGFTGLRIGIATARALAQALALPLAGVGSLEAPAPSASRITRPRSAAGRRRRARASRGARPGGQRAGRRIRRARATRRR